MENLKKVVAQLEDNSKSHKDFMELCEKIIDASMRWTGEDEEQNPMLKTIRSLAGYYLETYGARW